MIQKVSTDLDFLSREEEVLSLWKQKDVFRQSIARREGAEPFVFFDGPPTANGKPHIGHVLTRAMKDLIPRYQTMKGRKVLRKAGWNTHGLPVELEVEKALGLDGKEQIERYGIEPFIKACKESVWKYKDEWERMSERVGFWADMEHPYITYLNEYIESVWWSLKQVADRGLLYKGHKVVPYCPRCGTALSSHEVSQGYEEVTEDSAFVRFEVKDEENMWLYAWTTTPWTLPSNVALCVGPDIDYVKLLYQGSTVILAKELATRVLGEDIALEGAPVIKGRDLVGMEYEPLFDFAKELVDKPAWRVVSDEYVTLTDGTGIVHIAPAFGEDDARVGREYNLPFLQLVDSRGRMDDATPWSGLFVKDADPQIVKALEEAKLLHKLEPYTHNYPYCWRCHTPLIYYARATWFIRMTEVKDQLVANNRSVHWMPDNIKEGRMGNFVENVVDWGLSRERYWGTPLPVWLCECGHLHVVGSVKELCEMGKDVDPNMELHRPYIDRVVLTCPECGGEMHRTPEVIDCWYDAGAMQFAQWHYPFENQDMFKENFPADFISEAIDQTRGWFYTLLAIGTLLFDQAPFKNCLVLGHVGDKDGVKQSKHLNNVTDPWDVLNKQGADAVRWYFYTAGAPWLPSRFSDEMVSESQRKFMGTLWNTYAFFALYASIDGYDPKAAKAKPEDYSLMDKWALSKLHSLIRFVDEGMAEYKVTETARAIAEFMDELSNWYVRRCRERFWGKGLAGDKLAAFDTLYTILVALCGLCAPYTPFMAETMYQNLVVSCDSAAPESIHLNDFPAYNPSRIDPALEEEMERVIRAVGMGRACRSAANLKVRQPAPALYIKGAKLSPPMAALIEEELNVKAVEFVDDARAFTTYLIKPQMRTLGPKYGKLLGKIGEALRAMDGNDVMDAFAREEAVEFEVEGTMVSVTEADALSEPAQKPGFVAESDRDLTVVLNTNLTAELIEEGFVREVISKIQTMRKDSDFEVTDRIAVAYRAEDPLAGMIERGKEEIARAVLAVSLDAGDGDAGAVTKEWNINGEKAVFSVRVVK